MGFWIWNTEEVVALVEWIRAWNIAHDRKVTFYGFDMQTCQSAARHLLGYLHGVTSEIAQASEPALSEIGAKRCGDADGLRGRRHDRH